MSENENELALGERNEILENRVSDLKRENHELRATIEEMESEISDLKNEKKDLTEVLDRFTVTAKDAVETINRLTNSFKGIP